MMDFIIFITLKALKNKQINNNDNNNKNTDLLSLLGRCQIVEWCRWSPPLGAGAGRLRGPLGR